MSGDPWTWTETFSRTDRPSPLPARRCICGPDSAGENPDCRPDCPVHGADAPYDPAESDIGEVPF